jgi:hypothetical protein
MARRADHLSSRPVDIVNDGLTDDEVVTAVAEWLDELRASPGISLPISAAEELAEARRMGDV